jgi:hypothetical protein
MAGPAWLKRAKSDGIALDEAIAAFDGLGPVSLEEMIGRWRGTGLRSGHTLDGALEAFGWWGKEFRDPDTVHALLFGREPGRIVSVDPAYLPLRLAVALNLHRNRLAQAAFRAGKRLIATKRSTARLRMIEHRGVVTAAMIYDAQPITDVFRRVDADTLLGLMECRGLDPFLFVLERAEGGAPRAGVDRLDPSAGA